MNLARLIRNTQFLSEKRRLELLPLFWMLRIRVLEISNDWRVVRIRLPLSLVSRNTGGFMFGGSQAALADPIAALACARVFPGYSVWTRALKLDFLHEGRTDLELRFTFNPEQEQLIREDLAGRGRSTPVFEFGFYLEDGTLCTQVHNTVAIRPRGYQRPR
ncbi:MAG: PaaI family thioesterase [Acidiferrobacterales bacterium]